ncbi:Protein ssh4 [Hypsizygus marmoreus]|uniref:Protein ssh4 n=1 Tax=Hypsizygus marmoreus TaxID=39966 RepID=A0A369J0W4_HYPMA|nr:Protein ssh4 [Hypsizygus marmoreus]
MSFFKSLKNKISEHNGAQGSYQEPPKWAPAPEKPHQYGLRNEAPAAEYEAAEKFCQQYPPQAPRLVCSDVVDRINAIGCKAWGIEPSTSPRFAGCVQNASDRKDVSTCRVQTTAECKDICLLSDLPITAGLYDIQGKTGVYYELYIRKMEGLIAIGTACRPYPAWRLPGWNRLSAGLHLDDLRKFFEDPDGGRDYTDTITSIRSGDTVGCGYEFASGTLFFTYNGIRLPPAFTGIYLPRQSHDVFAAIGVEGDCDFEVNFGGDVFKWKEGNEWAWRVEGHAGRLNGSSGGVDDELPTYHDAGGY